MIRLLSCRHNLMGIIIIFSVIMRHLENWWPSHHAVANIQMNHYHTNLSREINWGCATATKKCESDRESVWNWQQTHRKSDTCLIFLYAAVAMKLTVRLTFWQISTSNSRILCQYRREFVKRQYISEFVHWLGRALKLTPNLLFSIPTAILTLFVRCNINLLDF